MADTALAALIAVIDRRVPPREAATLVAAFHDEAILNAATKLDAIIDKSEADVAAHFGGNLELGRSGVEPMRRVITSLRALAGQSGAQP